MPPGEDALEAARPISRTRPCRRPARRSSRTRRCEILSGEVVYGAVAARRVFDQHHRDLGLAELTERSMRPKPLSMCERLLSAPFGPYAESCPRRRRPRRRCRGYRLRGRLSAGCVSTLPSTRISKTEPSGPRVSTPGHGDVRLGTAVAALRTLESAQVGEGVEIVLVLRAAGLCTWARRISRCPRPSAASMPKKRTTVGRVGRQRGDKRVVRVEADRRTLHALEALCVCSRACGSPRRSGRAGRGKCSSPLRPRGLSRRRRV